MNGIEPGMMCSGCGSVTISRYLTVAHPSPHVEFVIAYEQAGEGSRSLTFTTQHRFSEFLMLHRLLRGSPTALPMQERLPSPKRLFHGDAVLERRRRELEQYLQDLLEQYLNGTPRGQPGIHPALCSFLKNSIPPREHHCNACTHNHSQRFTAHQDSDPMMLQQRSSSSLRPSSTTTT